MKKVSSFFGGIELVLVVICFFVFVNNKNYAHASVIRYDDELLHQIPSPSSFQSLLFSSARTKRQIAIANIADILVNENEGGGGGGDGDGVVGDVGGADGGDIAGDAAHVDGGIAYEGGESPRSSSIDVNFNKDTSILTTIDENDDVGTFCSTESVVVSWQAVCEDLCRSGYGGPDCGPQCSNKYLKVKPPTVTQFTLSFQQFCPKFCQFGLGQYMCNCPPNYPSLSSPIGTITEQIKNEICNFGCLVNTELKGCTKCSNKNCITEASSTRLPPTTTVGNVEKPVDQDTTTTATTTTPTNEVTNIAIETTTQPPPRTTRPPTPPPPPPPPTTTVQTPVAETTPDWSVLCKDLCRIGEGGSLCNCDIIPFDSE